MQNGQSGVHGRSLDSDSELWDPVHSENGSQPTLDEGSPWQAWWVWRETEWVVDRLGHCDENEANSPIKMTPQHDKGEVVYLSRTRRGTMRSKLVIDKINAMKMKLGSRVIPRRVGKTKVDSEISVKAVNSAKRKRVEEVMDLGQGDYQLPGTDKMLTDIAMVPPILMAGITSTGYKSKRSDRTLTGATLEMEIISHYGESTMKDFKPSPMNHGKGSVAGQLVPVEYNRLTVSETLSIGEPTSWYMEMLEYRNSARGYVMALEDEKAMEGYLETMLQGTTLKLKAYGTFFSVVWDTGRNDGAVGEPSMESSGTKVLRRKDEDYAKNTWSRGSTLRKNRVTTQVRLLHDGTDSQRIWFRRKEEVKRR